MARLLDGFEEIVHRFFLVSLECEHLILISLESKYRNKVSDPSEFEKELELLGTESIDIHPLLSDEHLELSLDLGTTVRIGTIYSYFSLILFEWSRAHWALMWDMDDFFSTRSDLRDDRYDLRDHLSCTHDEDIVTFSHSFFLEFIIVMEGRTPDDHSADIDCLEIGYWSHCSSTSD